MKIKFLGGVRTVTGSCFHLSVNPVRKLDPLEAPFLSGLGQGFLSNGVNDLQILVECGMYQGENSEKINKKHFQFNPKDIDYLFLTHAHIDHSGLIPKLVKEGFRGRTIATSATADLTEIMLYDSANIQEKDAEWLIKKALRQGREITFEPLYTVEDVKEVIPLFDRKSYGNIERLGKGIKYRFIDAGHILGSSTLEIWYQDSPVEKKIVFSGDIGKKGNPIINNPQDVEAADYVVMESTYGNRLHKGTEESIGEFTEAIKATFNRGGNVLIPAFAVGRTQDILYTLNKLVREKRLSPFDVYVDSPLAEEATKIYLAHPECFDEEAMKMFQTQKSAAIRLHFTTSVEESQRINRIKSGAVIIAGSGMCEGGRIRHHFKHNLWRSECSMVFTGFQARGTLGRRIIEGAKTVHVLGEEIAVKAKIYTIGGFSAHADQKGLLEWLRAFKNKPSVIIVHGEEEVSREFEEKVRENFGFSAHVPERGEEIEV